MRHDLIGPRRLRPAGTFNPIFTLTEERSDRVLKGLVMTGVTEGAQNGVLPGARAARPPQPALIVKAQMKLPGVQTTHEEAIRSHQEAKGPLYQAHERHKAAGESQLAKLSLAAAKAHQLAYGHHDIARAHAGGPAAKEESGIAHRLSKEAHAATQKYQEARGVKKAIEGQQPLMAPVGAGDPAYSRGVWTHQEGKHIEAAKHHIQADHFSRQKGGQLRAQFHNNELKKLKAQGANPQRDHYKQAIGELHPTFSDPMKSMEALGKAAEAAQARQEEGHPGRRPESQIAKEASERFAAARKRRSRPTVQLENPAEKMTTVVHQKLKSLEKAAKKREQEKEKWEISGYGKHEELHPFPGQEGGFAGSAAKHFKKIAEKPGSGIELQRRPQFHQLKTKKG